MYMYSIYNYTYIYFSVFKTNILKIIRVMHIVYCMSFKMQPFKRPCIQYRIVTYKKIDTITMKYQLTKENRFHKIVQISKSSLNLRRFVNIKRQMNIFCNVSIVHEYVIPIATGETGVDGLAKSSTDRLISRHIPGIGQNDFLACTSGRCAFALLHSHQVADVGQHRLEVRHFPRWSLNF